MGLADQSAGWRGLHGVIVRLTSQPDLTGTLQAVVDGVVDGLGFGVAALYYRGPDSTFEALAVAGPSGAREAVLAQRLAADAFDRDLDAAEVWGALRFVPHDRFTVGMVTHWIPDAEPNNLADAWHPLDALFVPLHAPTGQLVGVLSVDSPVDGRLPGARQRELLELFGIQAGITIDNARLRDELRSEHHLLSASEEAFRLAFDGSGVAMAMISLASPRQGRYLKVNQALCDLVGYPAGDLLARSVSDITHPDDVEADERAAIEAGANERDTYRTEKRYLRADGSITWVAVTTSVVGRMSEQELLVISLVEDITARRAAEQELTHRALHDPLTGLLNRQAVEERLTHAVQRTRRSSQQGAVLFCDLDGFKAVNDRFGHQRGDAVLAAVAQRLASEVRAVDSLARIGGDEFVIIAEQISTKDLTHLVGRIKEAVAQPLSNAGDINLTVSVGTARLTAHTADPASALREADDAMYRDKIRGRRSCRDGGTDQIQQAILK